ncbi:LamG domain-containing protein, partial [Serinicoccus chungangensis]
SELAGDSTWEVWVKPEDFDQRRVLLGKAYGGEGVLTLETTGRVYFFQGSAGANRAPFDVVRSNGTLRAGEWNHVVVTRSGSTVWMFLDGQLAGRKAMTEAPAASTLPLRIGGGYLGSAVGEVDEVAVYDRALSSADVAAHFAEIADGDHEGYGSLVAGDGARGHWRMDENEGD